ncbi:MAG: TonB-dependent receptor [Candidatus Marinimicrobia bacterium]|nr:TonB-dependent receptor [Candidatus Neomarinimicrobiota bacterium]
MKLFIKIVLFTLPLYLFGGETGKLVGTLTDAISGEPLAGGNIVLKNTVFGTMSDKDGEFLLLNIPASTYTLDITYIGYKQVTVNDVIVYADRTAIVNIEMEISAVAGDIVYVEAERPIIERDQTATTITVTEKEIADMPVNTYLEIMDNMAGIIDSDNGGGDDGIHVRGGRSGEIAYMVDGFFVEDAIFGGMGTDVARGGISELSVITGSFNAEYGEAMSGVVNIVTKEGSSEYNWNLRTSTDQFGVDRNDWGTGRVEGILSGPFLPFAPNFATFFITGDIYSTNTYLYKSYLPKDVLTSDINENGAFDDGDAYAMADLDGDGNPETMKKGALNIYDTYRDENRLTGKIVVRPIDRLKLSFGTNILHRESRNYNLSYRQIPNHSDLDWLESDLFYVKANYTFSKNMFATLSYSQFRNENWEGNPDFLNKNHELYAKMHTIPADWEQSVLAPGEEWVWFSHFAEPFNDLNGDGEWSNYAAEWWDDANGNGLLDWVDENGDSLWSSGEGERWSDWDEDGEWDIFSDEDGDGIPDTEPYADIDENGNYSPGVNTPLAEGDAYDNTSNYEFFGQYPTINAHGDTIRMATSDYYTYEHYKSVTKSIKGSLTWQTNKWSELKTGFEIKKHTLNNFRALGFGGGPYGSASDPGFVIWEKTPEQRSFYLQDKMEFSDLVVNLGIRWDYMDPNSRYADPTKKLAYLRDGEIIDFPDNLDSDDWGYLEFADYNNDGVPDSSWFVSAPNTKIKKKWSPRIAFGYPITDRMAFHFSYGQFYQYPEYQNMYRLSNSVGYSGLPNELTNISNSSGLSTFGNAFYPFPYGLNDWYIPPVGSPNLSPESTIAYEIGLRSQISDFFVLRTTMFYKDIYDYIAAVIYDADPTEFSVFENMDYGNSKGLEFSLQKLFNHGFGWTVNYTYSRSEGNASNEFQHWDDAYSASVYGTVTARKTITMPWDQPHTINVAVNLIHPSGFGVNLIGNWGSGLPYTPSDDRGRPLDESNSGRMPATSVFDLKAYYDMDIPSADIRFYADVTNLFDRVNVLNVFNNSGKPDESLNPSTSPMWEHRPYYFGAPRHIELGISVGMK